MARLVVFTDASVLYGAIVRDLLLQLGADKMLDLKWTEAVHLEWMQALVRARPELADRVERTRSLMIATLPDAMVRGYEHRIDGLDLPDPDDRHVLAAALECGAQMILTFNLRHFPEESLAPAVSAIHPDGLLPVLAAADPDRILASIRKVRHRMAAPSMTPAQFLDALLRAHLPLTAKALGPLQDRM